MVPTRRLFMCPLSMRPPSITGPFPAPPPSAQPAAAGGAHAG